MKIKLNVSRLTFQKYLVELNYSYTILQYEDLILSIKRKVKERIKDYFLDDNLKEGVQTIFGDKHIPILSLGYDEEMTYISSEFLTTLIEEGVLDLFFKDKRKFTPSLALRNMIYVKEKYGYLNVNEVFPFILRDAYDTTAYKNAEMNGKNGLSYEEELELTEKINVFVKKRVEIAISRTVPSLPIKGLNIEKIKDRINKSEVFTDINLVENNISEIKFIWSEETVK